MSGLTLEVVKLNHLSNAESRYHISRWLVSHFLNIFSVWELTTSQASPVYTIIGQCSLWEHSYYLEFNSTSK